QSPGSSGVGVPVDAPALVGVFPVGAVFKDAVDGVAGGKDRLAPGLDVGRGVGVIAGIPVLVVAVEGQIAPKGQLLGQGQPGPDQVPAAPEALGGIGDGLLPEGDVEVDLPADHIDQGRGHAVLELDDAELAGVVDLQGDAVAGLVSAGVHQRDGW